MVKFHYRVLQLTAVFFDNLTPFGITFIYYLWIIYSKIAIFWVTSGHRIFKCLRMLFGHRPLLFTLHTISRIVYRRVTISRIVYPKVTISRIFYHKVTISWLLYSVAAFSGIVCNFVILGSPRMATVLR